MSFSCGFFFSDVAPMVGGFMQNMLISTIFGPPELSGKKAFVWLAMNQKLSVFLCSVKK